MRRSERRWVLKSGTSKGYSEREAKAEEPKRECEARGDVGVGGRNKEGQGGRRLSLVIMRDGRLWSRVEPLEDLLLI